MERAELPRTTRYAQALRAAGEEYADRPKPAPEVRDQDLVRRSLEGDVDAFAGLMARYERKAFWIAFHVLGRVEEARDVVQEAFLRVHRSLERFDFSKNFYTWFYRIVTNLAIDALRKQRNEPTGPDLEVETCAAPPSGHEAPDVLEARERAVLVRRVLDVLPPRFRTVLALRDLHGFSCREIAPILGLTYATVRWRLHKARQLFKLHWERLSGGREEDR